MIIIQLEESERDLIVGALKGDYIDRSADAVEKKIKIILEKLTQLLSAEIKLKFHIYIHNNGDGSASAHFFNNQEEAEKYAESGDERLTDDIEKNTIIINGLGQIKYIPRHEE